jgi:peptidoglycan/xylan/chitin deacetylase (PgdA/CDA1 family)
VPATFILSLDCEGKWGVADSLTDHHRRELSTSNLRAAYRSILDLLEEFDVEATFAFAGAFSQSEQQFARLRPAIEALSQRSPEYLRPALADIDETNGDGWHGSDLVDAVGSSPARHEIALHGVTHVPWTQMDDSFVQGELRLFEVLEGPIRESRTFVYPRNLVAHSDKLAKHGFLGFRKSRPISSRFASLMSEFNVLERPERPGASDGIVAIPAGFFLNWQKGPRRLVPPSVSRRRATNLLKRAAGEGSVVHYWLHPENVATAPSTLGLLRSLVVEVSRMRERGHCEVLTQLGYCRRIESLS